MRTLYLKLLGVVALGALVLAAQPVQAEYPEGPIEIVIPFGAGGGADIEGRLLAKEMSKVLGVPLTPVNRSAAAAPSLIPIRSTPSRTA